MASSTKSTDRPPSTYRQLQAQQTKDRIADAARRLFATHGYGATSMDAIAVETGVANRTVYAAFGAKRDILAAIYDGWLQHAGADERAQAAIAERTPRSRVKAAAHWLRTLYETGFDVVRILDSASDEDEETQVMLRARLTGRHATMDAIIESLDGSLRRPLPEAQAIYRAFAAPGVYQELVVESGWSPDEFEAWVADALTRQLLAGR